MQHIDAEHDLDGFEAPQTSRNIMQVLWQRKAFVILGAIIGLAGGFLVYTQKTTVYASNCPVMVQRELPVTQATNGMVIEKMMEETMQAQTFLIRSPGVIKPAVDKLLKTAAEPGNAPIRTFEGVSDPVGFALANLNVARETDKNGGSNNIMNLSFSSAYADDCPKVLTAVVDAYQAFLEGEGYSLGMRRFKALTDMLNNIKKDLDKAEDDYKNFADAHSDVIFGAGDKGINPHQEEIARLNAQRSQVDLEMSMLTKQIEIFEEAITDKSGPKHLKLLQEMGKEKPQREIPYGEEQLLEIKKLLLNARFEYGDNHPKVQILEDTLKTMRKHFEEVAPASYNLDRDPVAAMLNKMKYERRVLAIKIGGFDAELGKLGKEWKSMSRHVQEENTLRTKRNRLQQFFEATMKQYTELAAGKDAPILIVNKLQPPTMGAKVSPVLSRDLLIGLVFGLFAGTGLAYLADMADKSFRSPEEIRKQMGLPLVGHIPFFLPDAETAKRRANGEATVEPMLCCYFKPKSLDSEAYRAVRTTMFFNTQSQGLKVIQVTSPNKGDGKSLLISNLAVTTAQSGKRVLMIDADCRRPRQHKVFNLHNNKGLVNVLNSEARPEDVIQETCVPGLSVMSSGPIPPNPSELLVSPLFKETLDYLRTQFDYIFVDTPPLLAVTDPCIVAGNVDGLFLAIRLTRKGRPDAERAREILQSLKVRTFGIVVNGVTRTNAGMYSSQAYDYSDKYMDYEDDDKAYYYADDDEEAAREAKA